MVRLPFKTNLVFRIGPKLLAQNFCAIFGPIVLVTPIKSVCPLTSKNKNLTVRNVTSAFNINDYSVIECLLFTCYQPTYLPTCSLTAVVTFEGVSAGLIVRLIKHFWSEIWEFPFTGDRMGRRMRLNLIEAEKSNVFNDSKSKIFSPNCRLLLLLCPHRYSLSMSILYGSDQMRHKRNTHTTTSAAADSRLLRTSTHSHPYLHTHTHSLTNSITHLGIF